MGGERLDDQDHRARTGGQFGRRGHNPAACEGRRHDHGGGRAPPGLSPSGANTTQVRAIPTT
ncbi:hypothetical protein ACF1BE_30680 [Streptomyces sp. NPDC014991]|uniref:hypothetical protein n=1 Tax=Streptomyces sp. NPDC014991 TaxID=3364935 RepID=UPI0036F50ECB